ncbi:MAG: pyridoxal-phosphate dependent enzyme, partial [Pseudomonadota bacterium]
MSQFKDDVAQAATAMRSVFEPTPCQENVYLSELYGARIFLKREDLSPVRSYKIRGAYNFFRKRTADGSPENFVCASAGNHAQGFAYVCNRLEKHGVVFMPVTTPQQKIDKTRAFGGSYVSIKLVGDIFDQCNAAALEHAEKNSAVMVPPFDHPDIIEGQATVAHELVAQMADAHIDHVMVAVGGGGLSSGMTRYFEEAGLQPHMHLLEPAGAPSLKTSLAAGERVKLDRVDNFVDGASVALVGAHTFDVLKRYADSDVSLISEDRLCTSLIDMLNIEGMVLEPAGVMAVDALKDFDPEKIKGKTWSF